MRPRSLRSYAGRFVVPLLLLAGAVSAWLVASELAADPPAPAASVMSEPASELPMASVRRLPEFASGGASDEALARLVAALPAEPGGLSCTQVLLDGQPVVDIRSDIALVPSYAQLLMTGHSALEILGPAFRYETAVMATALPDENGLIGAGIYLIGGGDPVLMSRAYALGFRPALATRTSIEDLAEAVAAAGVIRIEGGVIGVDRRYDDQRSLPGWPSQYVADGLVGPLTALQLDDAFAIRPSANQGVAVPAESPAIHAAERFVEYLAAAGVDAVGFHRTLFPEEVLPSLVPVTNVQSAPLVDIVFQIFATNDASAAELLLKELGVAVQGQGSTQAGGRAVQTVLQGQGVDVPIPFRDASGLDPIGGTSCAQLAGTIDSIAEDHPTTTALPAYDLPGVYGGRFAEVDMTADLRLIGGTHDGASGLVGRTVGDGAPRVSIASIINRVGGPTQEDLAYQQALIELVDELQGSITVDPLAPDE